MKQIVQSQRHGKRFVYFDDEDIDLLYDNYTWHLRRGRNDTFYVCGRRISDKKSVKMHRIIMNCPDGYVVDHIDGDGLNNRKRNLRVCTIAENNYNKKGNISSTSKYRGVSLCIDKCVKKSGKSYTYYKWKSQITKDGKFYLLGRFLSEKDAAIAYNKKAIELYGEFAYLNQVDQ